MDQNELKKIVRNEVILAVGKTVGKRFVPAAVSNRHVHLCRADIDRLFGAGYQLTPIKPLSQPGQYAAKETITLHGPKGSIAGIRVLGPERPDTQIEISVTDSFKLGIKPVVRMSGKVEGTPGGRIESQFGSSELSCGVMVSARHLHISAAQAERLNLKDGQIISLKSMGERAIVLENVIVRSGDGHDLEVHLDMDEANAAIIKNGDLLEIVESGAFSVAPIGSQAPQTPAAPEVPAAPAEPLSLVTEEDVKLAKKRGSFVLAEQGAIITPLAKDTARELNVEIKVG